MCAHRDEVIEGMGAPFLLSLLDDFGVSRLPWHHGTFKQFYREAHMVRSQGLQEGAKPLYHQPPAWVEKHTSGPSWVSGWLTDILTAITGQTELPSQDALVFLSHQKCELLSVFWVKLQSFEVVYQKAVNNKYSSYCIVLYCIVETVILRHLFLVSEYFFHSIIILVSQI